MQIKWKELSGKEDKLFINALEALQKEYGEGPFNVRNVFLINACLADAKAKKGERAKFIIIETTESGNGPAIPVKFFKNPPSIEEEKEQLLAN